MRGSVQCPFIIIRRNAVVNARMKISSQSQNPKSAAEGMLTYARGGRQGCAWRASPRALPAAAAHTPQGLASPTAPAAPPPCSRVSSPTAATTGRRVAIAYNSFVVGRGLVQLARDKVLSKADTIYICHVFPPNQNPVRGRARWGEGGVSGRCAGSVARLHRLAPGPPPNAPAPKHLSHTHTRPQVVKETMKVMRALTLQRIDSVSDEVTRDNAIDFGAAELEGYNVQLNVVLQVGLGRAGLCVCAVARGWGGRQWRWRWHTAVRGRGLASARRRGPGLPHRIAPVSPLLPAGRPRQGYCPVLRGRGD